MSSLNDTTPEKSAWGYKGLIVAAIIASTFIGFFYLAVSSEPDYMPSQQKARQQQQAQQQATPAPATDTENKTEATPAPTTDGNKTENTPNPATEAGNTPETSTDNKDSKPAQ